MARRVGVVFLLLVALMVCLALEPDSGTAASVGAPDVVGDIVGANHAKPLPQHKRVEDVVVVTVGLTFFVLVLARAFEAGALHSELAARRRRTLVWAWAHARRGPPARRVG